MSRLALIVLVGCGRIGFSPTRDATVSDAFGDTKVVDAPDAAAACVRVALADNFDDNMTAPTWVSVATAPVVTSEAGGGLVVQLADNVGGGRYGGYQSFATFDLRDHCMFVTYASVPASQPMTEMDFLALTSGGTIGFAFHNGLLDATYNPGVFQSFRSVPYDAAMYRVLLLREDSGVMTWLTSPDGIEFTTFVSTPTPLDVSMTTVDLKAGTFGPEASPGSATYDNFNSP